MPRMVQLMSFNAINVIGNTINVRFDLAKNPKSLSRKSFKEILGVIASEFVKDFEQN